MASATPQQKAPAASKPKGTLRRFWSKVNNDWVFNLAGMLAYNLLSSTFPILLILLAVAAFLLSADQKTQLEHTIERLLPTDIGASVIHAVLDNLSSSAGWILVVGLVSAVFIGSRLFIAMENCMSIIFRVPSRPMIRQNFVALVMLVLYTILVPTVFVVLRQTSTALGTAITANSPFLRVSFISSLDFLSEWLLATLLIGGVFLAVPNRRMHFKEIWVGTLITSGLAVLYLALFGAYQDKIAGTSNYGAIAGYIIVFLVFFYYLALILLLGAEINSWAAGRRELSANVASLLSVAEGRKE